MESDCLEGSKRGIVCLSPRLPEDVIVGVAVKKPSELVNMMKDRIAKENITQYVKSKITEVIDWRK